MNHAVKKQLFKISTTDIEQAKEIQQHVSDMLYSEIVPVMDAVFSGNCDENIVWCLDTLELDLGILPFAGFREHFIHKLAQVLTQTLKQQQFEGDSTTQMAVRGNLSTSVQTTRLKQLSYFLRTGLVPWGVADSSTFDPERCLQRLLQDSAETAFQYFTELSDIQTMKRIEKQFSPSAHQAIIELVFVSPVSQQIIQHHAALWDSLRTYAAEFLCLPTQDDIRRKVLSAVLHNPALFASSRLAAESLHDLDLHFLSALTSSQCAGVIELVEKQFLQASREREWCESWFDYFMEHPGSQEESPGHDKSEQWDMIFPGSSSTKDISASTALCNEQHLLTLLEKNPEAVASLFSDVSGKHDVVKRMLRQLSSTTHQLLLESLLSLSSRQILQKQDELWERVNKYVPNGINLPGQAERQEKILAAVLNKPALRSSSQLLTDALYELDLKDLEQLHSRDLHRVTETVLDHVSAESEQRHWYNNLLESYSWPREVQESDEIRNGREIQKQQGAAEKTNVLSQEKVAGQREDFTKKIRQDQSIAVKGSQYIDNAGLVLVWPFLNRYFQSLGLLEENRFVSEEHWERAVLLLYYVQTGKSRVYEHNLLFNKLLCDWPLEKPLCFQFDPSQTEEQETTELLLSVIQHWTVLKNTSIDGLRQSFLQREGRLTEKDHGWELFINRKGFDILLDQLPWSISTIYLPWMKESIFVEW